MERGRSRREEGFSLVELTVVLLIVSVLMVIGMAVHARLAALADDEVAQLDVITAVKVQALHHLQHGVFTDDSAVLGDLEPMLGYSADGADGTVVVRLEAATAASDVCVFVQTPAGDWYAVHHSSEAGDRYATSAPAPCTAAVVGSWPAESW
jgi:prepilin-type N-terminal cleavage/methylation domain-containing protein